MIPDRTADTVRLYYYTAMRWGMKTLWERRLKISRYVDVNDPFQLIPFDCSTRADRRLWEAQAQRLQASAFGMICFSDTWKQTQMWSQYGDKHTGMCLGFDVPRDHAQAVTYIDRPLPRPGSASEPGRAPNARVPPHALEAAVLRFKHEAWRHEREWRVRAPLGTAHEHLHFFPFDGGMELREVILGPRCALKPSDVVQAVHSPPLDVDVYAARTAYGAFEIERHEVVDSQSVQGFRARLAEAPHAYADIFETLDSDAGIDLAD